MKSQSGNAIQPALKFVVVREKMLELAKLAYGSNYISSICAPCNLRCVLFIDTDSSQTRRSRKIARTGGANNFSEEQLQYLKNLPAEYARYKYQQQVSDYFGP